MSTVRRPLAGCVVNCSISESEDSVSRGFPTWQVNRITLQIVAALFGQGAGTVFGHDWREDGVMEAVHGFAQQVQPPVPLPMEQADASNQPLLYNILPWPDRPHLSPEDLERLASTLRVESAGLPLALVPYEDEALRKGVASPLYRYVRARGLTHLRHKLNDRANVRICLGGRTSGFAGRYPGVIEEALIALTDRLPLYLAGFLGGAALQVVEAIQTSQLPATFCPLSETAGLYSTPPIREDDPGTLNDRQVDRRDVWQTFYRAGIEALAERNGLSVDENRELFSTPVIDRMIQLVLTGLSRLRAEGRI